MIMAIMMMMMIPIMTMMMLKNDDDDVDNDYDGANPSPPLFSPGLKRKGAAIRECAEYSHHHSHSREHCPLNIRSHIG